MVYRRNIRKREGLPALDSTADMLLQTWTFLS